VRWSDGETDNPRSVLITQDTAVTAVFSSNWLNVEVSSNNEEWGSVSGSGSYYYQTTAIVNATPYEHYHFLYWNDSNTVTPRNIQVVEDVSLMAVFVPETHSVQGVANNSNMGTVIGGGFYDYGSSAELLAIANADYHFVKWTDGNTQNPRSVSVLSDTVLTAVFAYNWLTVSLSSNNDQFGSTFGGGQYYYNSTCVIMAMPSEHYHFVNWSDGNTENPRNLTVVQDASLVANFEINRHLVLAQTSETERGSVSGGGEFAYGSAVVIYAEAGTGYYFSQWNDGYTGNPRIVTVTSDTLFTAQFGVNRYTILVTADNPLGGVVTGGGMYDFGSQIILSANPNSDYQFVQWNDGNADNPRVVLVTENAVYIANFIINHHSVDVVSGNPTMGTTGGGGFFNHGDSTEIVATPAYGYHFTQWGDGDTTNPRTVGVTSDVTYTAYFTPNSYALSVSSSDTIKGSVSGSGDYDYNTVTVISANANYGYHFTQWGDGNTDNPRVVVVTSDTMFTAVFSANIYTVTVGSMDDDKGNTSGGGAYVYGSDATITATPAYGYHFTQWSDGNNDNPRILVVAGDASYLAQFAPNTYVLTLASDDDAMGSVSGGGEYAYNTMVSISASAAYGYHFTQWGDGNTSNPRNVMVTRDTMYTAYFEPDSYTLTVMFANDNMGTVFGGGEYDYGETVTLAAAAAYGYHFVQWTDGNSANPRSVVVTGDAAYFAQFAPNTYTLTLAIDDGDMGSVAGGGEYAYNTMVSISASSEYGYNFTQWSDGNTSNPRSVMVTRDTMYTAYFEPDSYTLTVVSANDNMGTVSGGGEYDYGETAMLAATAAYGYHFVQWTDGNSANPRSVVVTGAAAYFAQFAPNTYTLTLVSDDDDMGSVAGSGEYAYNTMASISASADYGYHFTQWNDGNTSNPRNVMVTRDTMYTAYFEPDSYTLTVVSANDNMGTVSGGGEYDYGETAMLAATAAYGYHFVQWTDGNSANPRSVVVTGGATYLAQFAPNTYTLTLASDDDAMGSVAGGGEYAYNTMASISATAAYGYHFTQWSDGNTSNPRNVVVPRDTMYTAYFEPDSYTLTVMSSNDNMGTVSGGGEYDYGETAMLAATAAYGYHFVQWTDGNSANPRSVVVTGAAAYFAQFAPNTYTLTLASDDDDMGSVAGSGEYAYNTMASISATADYGYHFMQWSDGNTSNPRNVIVVSDTMFTAVFSANSYIVAVGSVDDDMGSTSGGGAYAYGVEATIAAVPAYGFHFTQWSDGNSDNPRTVTVSEDTTYMAFFVPNLYTLTVSSNNTDMGSVTGSGEYEYTTDAVLLATPNYGYHFTQWNDGNTNNPRVIEVIGDDIYTAQFAPNSYYVTVITADSNMGITIGGGHYDYGSEITVFATANNGYHFVNWDDGNTINPRNLSITGEMYHIAYFSPNKYVVSVFSNNTSMGSVLGGGEYDFNSEATLIAIPEYGYHFSHWNDGNTQQQRTVQVTQAVSFQAYFVADTFELEVLVVDSTQGSVVGSGSYSFGTQAIIQALPASHHSFVQWSDGNTSNPRVVHVNQNLSFTAIFLSDPQYELMVLSSNPEQGNVTGNGTYFYGDVVEIRAEPLPHYHFVRWSDGGTTSPRIITVTENMAFVAFFEPEYYIVNVTSNNDSLGTVTGAGEYEYGSLVTVTAIPKEGCHFVQWSNGILDSTYSFIADQNVDIMAVFSVNVGVDEYGETLQDWYLYAQDHYIQLRSLPVGESVQVLDMLGRRLYYTDSCVETNMQIGVPAAGVYLVVVGESSAKKISIPK